MVISGVNTVTYNGDGITYAWPYTFKVTDDSEIRVQLNNADGTAVIIDSDFYVDLVNSTVYYPGYAPGSEPPEADQPPKVQTGQTITVYREIPMTQEADLGEKWPFEVIEKGLDKLTMIAQQIDSGTKRTIDNALASMEMLADVVVDSGKLQHITDQYNAIDANAEAAADSADDAAASATAAANSATASANSATNAANSDSSATATAAALTAYLETKETLTAPAVDATLTIAGAAADAKVTGDFFKLSTGIEKYTYTSGKIIKTNTNPIDFTMVDTSGFACALIACQAGDTFTITGYDGSAAHIAVFTDDSGNKIEDYAAGSALKTIVAIAPTGATKLVVNAYTSYSYGCIKATPCVSRTSFDDSDFEAGGIYSTNGQNANVSRYRSKGYIDDTIEYIKSDANGRFAIFAYKSTDDSYVGMWDGSGVSKPGNTFFTQEFYFSHFAVSSSFSILKYRIVFENEELPSNLVISKRSGSLFDTCRYLDLKIEELKDKHEEADEIAELLLQKGSCYASEDNVSVVNSTSLFALYDALVSTYPNYVTKNSITKGDLTNYEYVFSTGNYNASGQRDRDSAIAKPMIMITAGVHGDERSAVMSTYSFFKALCENKQPISKILQEVTFRVIPCVTPWGFDNDKRWNENGVNINRNFDADWISQDEPFDPGYSGPSPASEYETQIVQDWIDANISNALMYIDFHNSGYNSEVSYLSAVNSLPNASKLKNSYRYGIANTVGYWINYRSMTNSSLIYSYTGQMNINGSTQRYAGNTGSLSATLETSWNQNNFGLNSAETIGVGAEVLGNMLVSIVKNMVETNA